MQYPWSKIVLMLNAATILLLCQPVVAASLEITAMPSLKLPALVFVEAENTALIPVSENRANPAELVSYQSTFKPAIQVLPTGTDLSIINADPILHNAHVFDHERTLFNVATPIPGTSVQRKLTRPGLFNVRCDLHPTMNAWIVVVSDSKYAVIESAGVYNIDDLASGQYKLHILQAGRQEKIIPLELLADERRKIQLSPR